MAGPPRPMTHWRRARSFRSRTRGQKTRWASMPSSLPCLRALSTMDASRLCALVIACRSPVKCRLMASIGSTWL